MPDMDLTIDRMDGWARLTLTRPAQKNALNTALLGAVADALGQLAGDAACRVVMLTGAMGNFAAGADIGEIEGRPAPKARRTRARRIGRRSAPFRSP